MTKEEIDLAFVRQYSVGGDSIGLIPPGRERKERVRVAIYKAMNMGERFLDTDMNVREAFAYCYGESIDRRGPPQALGDPNAERRQAIDPALSVAAAIDELGDDDDADDE